MSPKRYFALIVTISILTSGLVFLYGCGLQPTTGTESPVINYNEGTVSGYVYNREETVWRNDPIAGAIVTVSSESMTVEVTASTDTNGYFIFTGLAPGEVMVTATVDGYAQTLIENRDKFCFVVTTSDEYGAVTVDGSLEGIKGSPTFADVYIYNAVGKGIHYNISTSSITFEARYLPQNENLYYFAELDYGGGLSRYYYSSLNAGSSPQNISINCNTADTTVEVAITPHADYNVAPSLEVGLSLNNFRMQNLGEVSIMLNSGKVEVLPPLQGNDKYYAAVRANSTNGDSFAKIFNGLNAGYHEFDISGISLPSPFLTFPPNSASFATTVPTFEWSAMPGVTTYIVSILGSTFQWTMYTNKTKVSMPTSVYAMMPSDTYTLIVAGLCDYINFGGITRQDLNSPTMYYDRYVVSGRAISK